MFTVQQLKSDFQSTRPNSSLHVAQLGRRAHFFDKSGRTGRSRAGMYVVAVSGWGQEEDRKKSQDAGFDGHVVKPIERATLERVVADAMPRNS